MLEYAARDALASAKVGKIVYSMRSSFKRPTIKELEKSITKVPLRLLSCRGDSIAAFGRLDRLEEKQVQVPESQRWPGGPAYKKAVKVFVKVEIVVKKRSNYSIIRL